MSSTDRAGMLPAFTGAATTPRYGATAKVLHWLVVAALAGQYGLGWLMPDIHRGMMPGAAMTIHISIGIAILTVMLGRAGWRVAHPVAPDTTLPAWQRHAATGLHGLLYALVFATTLSGWFFASQRGWSISLFFAVPLPMLSPQGAPFARAIGLTHQPLEWALLGAIGLHIAAAMVHTFVYRDRVLYRMLPGGDGPARSPAP